MIKALIFDFDGLIIDTEDVWYKAYSNILNRDYSFDLKVENFARFVGSGGNKFWDYLSKEIEDLRESELKLQSRTHFDDLIINYGAREGVEDYLREAKASNMKIALASSSSYEWVTTHLKRLDLIHYFDDIVTSDDVEETKPSPELFFKSIHNLDVDPKNILVFEDSLNGLIASKSAQLKTVIVTNNVTKHLQFNNHDLKIKSMDDMTLRDVLVTLK